jgi:ATP-binding cassette subfamily G (WHITE) protein 1
MLKNLALDGRTVVASIHAPSSELFHLFDDLLILVDGRVHVASFIRLNVRLSITGRALMLCRTLRHWDSNFRSLRILPVCSGTAEFDSHVDFIFCKILNPTDNPWYNAEVRAKLCQQYDRSIVKRQMQHLIDTPLPGGILPQMIRYKSAYLVQARYLVRRSAQRQWRNPTFILTRLFATIFIAVFLSLVYLNITNAVQNPYNIMLNISGALFFIVVNQLFTSVNSVLTVFGEERVMFPVWIRLISRIFS